MENEKFQELVLNKLEAMQTDIAGIKTDVTEIKTELRGVWDDILRLDKRLTAQDEELVIMKRFK